MIISGIVAVNAEKILSCGLLVLGVVMLHNLCGMGIGLGAAKILHIEYDKATAIAIEVGMQNSGLAISLATANFAANPLATLPGAIFSVWHNISGSLFAGIVGAENRRKRHIRKLQNKKNPAILNWQNRRIFFVLRTENTETKARHFLYRFEWQMNGKEENRNSSFPFICPSRQTKKFPSCQIIPIMLYYQIV